MKKPIVGKGVFIKRKAIRARFDRIEVGGERSRL
jgi:hypothetical protein